MMCRRARTTAGSRRRVPRSVSRGHYSRNGLFREILGQAVAARTYRLFQVSPAKYKPVHIRGEVGDLMPDAAQGAEIVDVATLDGATGLNHIGLGGQLAELLVAELGESRVRLLGGESEGLKT